MSSTATMSNLHKLSFTLILILAFFLRFWNISKLPPSLNWDEISHGYDAYSLLQTGKDQWGNQWPIFNFRAYGDYPTVANLYLTIPFIKFLGLNELSTRLPTAILGFLIVPLSYFLSKIIFKNKNYALIVMLLVAISPWTVFSSRAVFQSTIALFFLLLGITLNFYGLKKATLLIPGTIFWALSAYAYHNTRIVAPFLFVLFILFFRQQLLRIFKTNKTVVFISLFLFLFITIPQLVNLLTPESRARSRWVFVINENAINYLEQQRNNFKGNPLIAKIIYNKPTYFTVNVFGNYLEFINPKTIFFEGSKNFQFNVPNTGILFSSWLPFFYIGLIILLLNYKNQNYLFLLAWYIVGLIPSVITAGDFPVIRAMSILPLPQIAITLGIFKVYDLLHKQSSKTTFLLIITFISLLQLYSYWQNYTKSYFLNYSESWQYGYKEAVTFAKANYDNYDQIIFTKKYGEPHEFVLFYWPWDPAKYQNDKNKSWNFHADWYWVDSFDKFKFVNDWEIKSYTSQLSTKQKNLLITSPNNFTEKNSKKLSTIKFLDNKPAFDIVSYE